MAKHHPAPVRSQQWPPNASPMSGEENAPKQATPLSVRDARSVGRISRFSSEPRGAAIIFSSILILQKLRTKSDEDQDETPSSYTHIGVVVAVFVYILAFRPVGYFISSTVFVFALILLFSSFEKLLQKALISVAIVVIGYVMFQQLFGVRLPTPWE